MDGPVPDYYATLGVASTASSDEIRQAYKRESLRSHPDRFPNSSASERQRHTARFQSLADAYYVLSDTARRSEYDSLRRSHSFNNYSSSSSNTPPGGFSADPEKEQESSYQFFKSFFGGAGAGASSSTSSSSPHDTSGNGAQPQANGVFSDVFEELMRPEVHRVLPFWQGVGAVSGAGLGFISFNLVGAIGGAVLGGTLGKIRDKKGKSVGEVFMGLGASQRAEVLKALAMKVLGSMG
jgi:curved DNA-binding protein CbpA